MVIATAGSQQKAKHCLALGADHVVLHREEDTAARVMEITGDQGAEVVFDLVGGELRDKSFACMALEGRYVAAGFCGESDDNQDSAVLRKMCAMNISIIGGLMAWRSNPEPFLRQFGLNPFDNHTGEAIHKALCAWLASGAIKIGVIDIIDFEDLPKALTAMKARESIGKTVIKVNN